MVIDTAQEKFGRKLSREQEILFNFSDIIMESYVAEFSYLRVQRLQETKGEKAGAIYKDILDVYLFNSSNVVYKQRLEAIYSFVDETKQCRYVKALRCFTKVKRG